MVTPQRLSTLTPFAVGGGLWLASWAVAHQDCPALSVQRLAAAVSGGLLVWFFAFFLQQLTPGTHTRSRLVYSWMALALSPVFVKAGTGCEAYLPHLLLALLCLWALVKILDRPRQPVWWALGVLSAGALVCHGGLRPWAVTHLFQAGFGAAGQLWGFALPNWCCVVVFPLMHPGFCLLLPGLFLLFKKTDLHLSSKKALLAALVCSMLAISGLAQPKLPDLLPAYAIGLLLLFPAWDRFFSYGFYFFPRLAWGILILLGVLQFVFLMANMAYQQV